MDSAPTIDGRPGLAEQLMRAFERLLAEDGTDAACEFLACASLRVEEAQPAPTIVAGGGLTQRELETLRLLPDGSLGQKDIARTLAVSRNTLKTHVKSLYLKLGVHSRAEAITEARRLGLLPTRHVAPDGWVPRAAIHRRSAVALG